MTDFASLVIADGPHPDHVEELALFGQFVGEWKVTNRSRHRGGPWSETSRTWIFGWVLGGRAVADVLLDDAGATLGMTVRAWDATNGVWRVTWTGVAGGDNIALTGRAYGESGIRQESTSSSGLPVRWNFSEIATDSFQWDGWVADDEDGPNWELEQHMDASRIR